MKILTNEIRFNIQRLFRKAHTISVTLWEQGKGPEFCSQLSRRLNCSQIKTAKRQNKNI